MNYEALGRYVEAKEKMAPLLADIEAQGLVAQSALDSLMRDLPRIMQSSKPVNPQMTVEKLRLATESIAEKLQQTAEWAQIANSCAAACGKPELPFPPKV